MNTTITGNTAVSRADRPGTGSGTGADVDARGATPSTLTIVNSAIAGNFGSKRGGGISVSQGYSPLHHRDSPRARRPAPEHHHGRQHRRRRQRRLRPARRRPFRSLGHNLASDRTCPSRRPSDLPDTNPRLGPLANNGGPTDTLALLPGSPAINAGGSAGCPATDQRGVPRPPGHCDIGAFQLVSA